MLNKILSEIIKNKLRLNFKYKIFYKSLSKKVHFQESYPNVKYINKIKDICKLYRKIDFAISSVGNTAFELGFIGVPTIHITKEKREIPRAKKLQKLGLGKYINNNKLYEIIEELNKFIKNKQYTNNLIRSRIKFFKQKNLLLKIINEKI